VVPSGGIEEIVGNNMNHKKPDHPFVKLTDRQFEILKKMNDEEEEFVGKGNEWWVGYDKTNWKTAKCLLVYCLISGWEFRCSSFQYLHINESGQAYLAGEKMIYQIANGENKLKKVDRIPLG